MWKSNKYFIRANAYITSGVAGSLYIKTVVRSRQSYLDITSRWRNSGLLKRSAIYV